MPKDNIQPRHLQGFGRRHRELRRGALRGLRARRRRRHRRGADDNRNRTASNVRSYFTKSGGALGETNSVSFLWDRVGEIVYSAKVGDADKVMEAAIEAGADDVQSDDDGHRIITAFAT